MAGNTTTATATASDRGGMMRARGEEETPIAASEAARTVPAGRRLAKNTLLLYARTFLAMLVSLYTSRVVLGALGVEDFGIYNVVGGAVAMFALLSGSLTAAISRYITFEMGVGDESRLKEVFATSVTLQLLLLLAVVLFAETVGLWFLNTQLNLPAGRRWAAGWVYQFSVCTFVVGLMSVPYSAVILAHERMTAFAVISLLETAGKLLAALLIPFSPGDALIFYAGVLALCALLVRCLYTAYCRRSFPESRCRAAWHPRVLRGMYRFAGWNFLGASSALLMGQGVNLLVNMFFGVALNAAQGIATQVNSALSQFTGSFTMAVKPQITKSYAQGDYSHMYRLACLGSKYSFFLMWILALPLLLQTDVVLKLWLKGVPDYAVLFVRLNIVMALITVLSETLITIMLATGNIRNYQILVGGTGLLTLPLVYILFKAGFPPASYYAVYLLIFILQLGFRLRLLGNMVKFPVKEYCQTVICKALLVVLLSAVLPGVFALTVSRPTVGSTLFGCFLCLLSTVLAIYGAGLTAYERSRIKRHVSIVRRKLWS